jgi:hypothetical protein
MAEVCLRAGFFELGSFRIERQVGIVVTFRNF